MSKHSLRSQVFANEYRLENLNSRDYLVVPAVPVQEQVMNNYLVPAEELEMAETWNGTSICIRHPKLNNGSVNVPQPDVAVIGKFYNGSWDGSKVTGEYWIDVSEAMRYAEGQYILNSIYANQVLETSTGYYAAVDNTSGEFNGRPYDIIHRNLRPDHIAILVDEIGACSVADGCGVNRNSLLHQLYTNVDALNGGPGSGFWGHLGRPGQVGGANPSGKSFGKKRPASKRLKKGIKAYYVAGKSEAEKKSKLGFKTRVSLMSKEKAAALFNRMTKGGSEPAVLEVNLKKGDPYETISANGITVPKVPADSINIITFDTLQKRTVEKFTNAADCNCTDAKAVVENETSITQRVDNLRTAFYKEFNDKVPYSMYVMEYYDDYVVVESNNSLWKCTYTQSGETFSFQDMDSWTRVMPNPVKYVEHNVTGDLPARAKKLWEKVYQTWLKDHPKDKSGASKRAWGAIKQAGWKKGVDGVWAKNSTLVKGVPTVGTRNKTGKGIWTVRNQQKQSKEKQMRLKLSLNSVLEALRLKGVTLNEDDLPEDMEQVLELEDPTEDDEEEQDTTPVAANARVQNPLFTNKQLDVLRKLADANVDFNAITNLASQLPTVLEIARNAEAERTQKKTQLIAGIKTNAAQPFSDEELEAMPLNVLTKLNGQYAVDYSGLMPAPYQFTTNAGAEDDETLAVPSIILNTEEEM